jgi:4-hydroxy-tetrahydrodipicolinate synthase
VQGKRWDEAMVLQRKLWRVNEALRASTSPPASRRALRSRAMTSAIRAPQAALTAEQRKVVEAVLREVD